MNKNALSNRQLVNTLATWHRELTKTWGKDKATQFVQQVQTRYEGLYAQRKRLSNRALRTHLENHILPGLALYQELRADGLEQDDALNLTASLFAGSVEPQQRSMARLGRLPFFYSLLKLVIRPTMKRQYPAEGWNMEWVEVSQDQIAFNIHRCFYLDTLTEYGAPELTALFCRFDDLVFEHMSPRVSWERTRTLARGGDLCDFRFRHARSSRRQ